jgi:hypothetical protein
VPLAFGPVGVPFGPSEWCLESRGPGKNTDFGAIFPAGSAVRRCSARAAIREAVSGVALRWYL